MTTGLRIHVIKEGHWPTLELAECAARVCANLTGFVHAVYYVPGKGYVSRRLDDDKPYGRGVARYGAHGPRED